MTTLNGTINSTVDVLRVSADNGFKDNGFKFRIDDEILAFLGYDRHDSAAIIRLKGGDLTYWHVARAQDGTTAASHTSGATLYAVVEGFVTGSSLTPPDPFGYSPAPATPTLAEVLAEGNTVGTTTIVGANGYLDLGNNAYFAVQGTDELPGTAGHMVTVYGGNVGAGSGAGIDFEGAGAGETNAKLNVFTNASSGNSGEAVVSDGVGKAVWGGITVGSGAPTLAPDGKLPIYLDSGASYKLYIWDGAAWRAP